jgi:molybdopterin-containing oxidoreductase family iron-sulfur binding subunit
MNQVPNYPQDKVVEITGLKPKEIQAIGKALQNADQPLIMCGGISTTKCNGSVTAHYAALLQWALGMIGTTVDFDHACNDETVGTIGDLVKFGNACDDLKIGVAIFSRLHGFTAMPAFVGVMKKARFKVAVTDMPGPITEICNLVLPLSHFLESWGDAEPEKGLKSVVQPAVKPIHDTKSEGDILLYLMGKETTYRDYLAGHWQGMDEKWIDRGFKTWEKESRSVELVKGAALGKPESPYKKDCLFIVPSLRGYDGRSTDIALLNEIPEPLTAISYGRWISVSESDGGKKNLAAGDIVSVETIVGNIKAPVYLSPGLTPGIMTISIDALAGTDLQVERGSGEFMFCLEDVRLTKTGEVSRQVVLAGAVKTGGRGILPHLEKHGHPHEYKRHTLYPPHEHKDYRWGMVIDLDLCTGCSACVAACYIENNIPVVGKVEHLRGREMSWLRIEPYYNNPARPEFVPMLCQQCDNAPCETVCPVFATYHNPEGLNAQVYNRCVGTRYCANNCPYKVRRFNWFDRSDSLPLYRVSSPDLSVRPKGVMEKCTFCIQRIRYVKDRAKDEKRLIQDGEVIPACAQTCPTGAITFGNLMDPKSTVSRLSKSRDAYRIQEQLGTEPAIYYIKREKKGNHEGTKDTKKRREDRE